MSLSPSSRILVIGIGNEQRGDDAVGLLLARKITERAPEDARVIEQSGEAASLMEAWAGWDTILLLDAVSTGAPPGTIHRLDVSRDQVPSDFFHCSTHSFGLADSIEMARALDELPDKVVVFGIEGISFEIGDGLSDEVAAALDKTVDQILREIANHSILNNS